MRVSKPIPGDIVLFKGHGFVFNIFSKLLSLLDPGWRKLKWKPWHMGIVWGRFENDLLVAEGYSPISRLHYYSTEELAECRYYRRIENIDWIKAQKFLRDYLGKRYDVQVYFWTTLGYLLRHYWGRPIKYFMDNRFSCWEFVYSFCLEMGYPLCDKFDFPMITDFLKVEGEICASLKRNP